MTQIERKKKSETNDIQVSYKFSFQRDSYVLTSRNDSIFSGSIHDGVCNRLFIASVGCYATGTYADGDAMSIVR